jgi:hypothetical protein
MTETAAAPQAPTALELIEATLAGVLRPSVFDDLARRPAPAATASLLTALTAAGATVAVVVAHGAASAPDFFARFPLWLVAVAGAASIVVNLLLYILFAAALHFAGNLSGGSTAFARGLEVAAMLTLFGPIQVLCNWFAFAWIMPVLLAAWTASLCLSAFYGVRPGVARTFCAALALAGLGAQMIGHDALDRARSLGGGLAAPAALAEMPREIRALAPAPQIDPVSPQTSANVSSLDLLRGGGMGFVSDGPAPAPAASAPQAAQALQANAANLLDTIEPFLNNPALTRNMTAAQKADVRELKQMIADVKAQMASGRPLSNEDFSRRTARYQQLLLRVMAAGIPAAAPAGQSSSTGGGR